MFRRAEEQPQQMFQTPIQAVNAAGEEPAVMATRQAADAFEKVASHNAILLLASVCILGYLWYAHSDVLFGSAIRGMGAGVNVVS